MSANVCQDTPYVHGTDTANLHLSFAIIIVWLTLVVHLVSGEGLSVLTSKYPTLNTFCFLMPKTFGESFQPYSRADVICMWSVRDLCYTFSDFW